jgi:hypothetical protein
MLEPGKWEANEESHNAMVRNLLNRTKNFSKETLRGGANWYSEGQEDSQFLGQQFDAKSPAEAGAAALARLSPKTEWGLNRMMGLQLLHTDDKAKSTLEQALSVKKEGAQKLKAAKLPKEDKEGREAIVAPYRTEAQRLRGKAGLKGTPLNLQSTDTVVRALKVSRGEVEPMGEDVFPGKPGTSAAKIKDFASALATGGASAKFPIDFHAYDAAMNRTDLPAELGNAHMKKAGVYHHVQTAYIAAHAHALRQNLVPSTTTLGDFQAMHWVHQQGLKKSENVRSAASSKGAATAKRNILENHPELDPTKYGLRPLNLGDFQSGAEGR